MIEIDAKLSATWKRIRKANKLAKALAHGGFGENARLEYIEKYGDKPVKFRSYP